MISNASAKAGTIYTDDTILDAQIEKYELHLKELEFLNSDLIAESQRLGYDVPARDDNLELQEWKILVNELKWMRDFIHSKLSSKDVEKVRKHIEQHLSTEPLAGPVSHAFVDALKSADSRLLVLYFEEIYEKSKSTYEAGYLAANLSHAQKEFINFNFDRVVKNSENKIPVKRALGWMDFSRTTDFHDWLEYHEVEDMSGIEDEYMKDEELFMDWLPSGLADAVTILTRQERIDFEYSLRILVGKGAAKQFIDDIVNYYDLDKEDSCIPDKSPDDAT